MYFAMLMILVMMVATLLQTILPGWAILGYARFPLLLGVVLYYALNHKLWIAIGTAFVAGLLQDGMSFVPLGYSAFIFCVIALIAGHYKKMLLSEALVTALFFGAIGSFMLSFMLFMLLNMRHLIGCSGFTAALRIMGGTILGAVSIPPIFLLLKILHHSLDLQEKEDADV